MDNFAPAVLPARIRHVIWDWNGTLLDDVDACVSSINTMLRDRGMPEVDAGQYRELFCFPVQNYYRKLGFDFHREDWNAVAVEFHRLYDLFSAESRLRPGILSVLEAAHRRGLPMSILSASKTAILRRMAFRHEIEGFFEHMAGLSDLYAVSKIEAGRTLLADLDTPPETVLIVGDTIHDSEVARELSCQCVLLAGGHQAAWRLAEHATVLSAPQHIPDLFFRSAT